MEKAILKTLIYADIFDYPLKINELHKWLIGKKVNLRQIEKALKYQKYYYLPKRSGLVAKRKLREKQSMIYFRKAQILSRILKFIPWIKLVGISGGLALNNAAKGDDIDLFIITAKNRLWICRILTLGLLSLLGQRRKRQEKGREIAGKLCVNILLEEDKLEQESKDIFVAHEVLQMRVLWQRDGIYTKYLSDNSWAFRFLPNWLRDGTKNSHNTKYIIHNTFFDIFEKLAKKFQLWYMEKPQGMERIEDGALYFHPQDCRLKVLQEYRKRLAKIISP